MLQKTTKIGRTSLETKLDLDERFYAEHKFADGIGLAEYQQAALRLDAEEKAFLWATNITSFLAPLIWLFGYQLHVDWAKNSVDPDVLPTITTVFVTFSMLFSLVSIKHIAISRKSRVYAERKIVLLRRSMGVKYGRNSLILPSWRLEGADNPFGLPMFPGYSSYSFFSILILSIFSTLSVLLLFDNIPLWQYSANEFEILNPSRLAIISGSIWFCFCVFVFRISLNEQNENIYLWKARFASFLTSIPLVPNIEYNLYRGRLEIAEAARIGAQTEVIVPIALSIEDKAFYQHRGINWRGVARAFYHYAWRQRVSGGSSITQQCARTNFLVRLTPAWRRKIVEFFLARWLESVSTKDEIISMYLTTARFDSGIYGFHRAFRHYFPDQEKLDRAISFILVERLGNVRSQFLGGRIEELLRRLVLEGLLDETNVVRVGILYQKLIDDRKIENQVSVTPAAIVDSIIDDKR